MSVSNATQNYIKAALTDQGAANEIVTLLNGTFTGIALTGASLALTGALSCTTISCTALTATSVVATGTVNLTDNMTITDAKNIILNATTGTKIGTATTQKMGFYNAAPVAQQATTGTTTGFTAGAGTGAKVDSTHTGGSGSTAYTVSDVVLALKNLGFLAA